MRCSRRYSVTEHNCSTLPVLHRDRPWRQHFKFLSIISTAGTDSRFNQLFQMKNGDASTNQACHYFRLWIQMRVHSQANLGSFTAWLWKHRRSHIISSVSSDSSWPFKRPRVNGVRNSNPLFWWGGVWTRQYRVSHAINHMNAVQLCTNMA